MTVFITRGFYVWETKILSVKWDPHSISFELALLVAANSATWTSTTKTGWKQTFDIIFKDKLIQGPWHSCRTGRLAWEMYVICWEIKCQSGRITSISSAVESDCNAQQSSSCGTLQILEFYPPSSEKHLQWSKKYTTEMGSPGIYFEMNLIRALRPLSFVLVFVCLFLPLSWRDQTKVTNWKRFHRHNTHPQILQAHFHSEHRLQLWDALGSSNTCCCHSPVKVEHKCCFAIGADRQYVIAGVWRH